MEKSGHKVLIITYYWPPSGGAGVQRWLKFSKYLPGNGWEPLILTVDPENAAYPSLDYSLEKEITGGTEIYRTKATDWFRFYGKGKKDIPSAGFAKNNDSSVKGKIFRFIRGNFFIPDPRRGWNKFAFRKACELIDSEEIKHVITTSPPHSTQLIGLRLKKKYPDIRWIADLRDPWTDIYYYKQFYPTLLSRKIDSFYERKVLKTADKLITVGNSLKELFSLKLPGINYKTEVIFNGYDPDDFSGLSSLRQDIFTISYTGTLSPAYPVTGLLEALVEMRKKGEKFRLRFTGEVSSIQRDEIIKAAGEEYTEFNSYADHRTAINNMLNSSVLLLIIPDHETSKSIITGKIFEYIATCLPVVCLGPVDGEAAKLLEQYGNGKTFSYDDSPGILEYLESIRSGKKIAVSKSHEIFRRDFQVRKIISMLE